MMQVIVCWILTHMHPNAGTQKAFCKGWLTQAVIVELVVHVCPMMPSNYTTQWTPHCELPCIKLWMQNIFCWGRPKQWQLLAQLEESWAAGAVAIRKQDHEEAMLPTWLEAWTGADVFKKVKLPAHYKALLLRKKHVTNKIGFSKLDKV